MSLSTFSALSALLVAVTMSPAVLNTLSLGTLVDGIPSRFLASLTSSGKWDSFVFHHIRGLAFKGMEDCFLKCFQVLILLSVPLFFQGWQKQYTYLQEAVLLLIS